jgi:hypothetical protein
MALLVPTTAKKLRGYALGFLLPIVRQTDAVSMAISRPWVVFGTSVPFSQLQGGAHQKSGRDSGTVFFMR